MMIAKYLTETCRCLVSGEYYSNKLPKWTEQVYHDPIQGSRCPEQDRHCHYGIGL